MRKLPAVVAVNVPPSCLQFMKDMTSPSLPRKSGAILKTLSGRGSRLFPLPIVPRAPVFSRSRFFLWCSLTGASAEERGVYGKAFPFLASPPPSPPLCFHLCCAHPKKRLERAENPTKTLATHATTDLQNI